MWKIKKSPLSRIWTSEPLDTLAHYSPLLYQLSYQGTTETILQYPYMRIQSILN